MDIDKLRELMSGAQRTRWDDRWKLLVHPEKYGATDQPHAPYTNFLAMHAQQLVTHGIAHAISAAEEHQRPTRAGGYAFVVKEVDSTGKPRLRAILDPTYINATLHPHYKANVDLRHISAYADAVTEECAATGDLAVSFYQIELPDFARPWFRFRDSTGALYEMCRLPMGHKVAAELMQIAMETIAGIPRAVDHPQHRNALVRHNHVWIDGFRIASSHHRVRAALEVVTCNAAHVGATFKEPPTIGTTYTFIGVAWNHDEHSVAVAPKTIDKIPRIAPTSARRSEYEKIVARLIFAAGALRLALARWFFVLKIANRYTNQLNRGRDDNELVFFPESLLPDLQAWIDAAHTRRVVPARDQDQDAQRPDVLYIDASTFGWGAYFISHLGEIAIIGGAWPLGTEATCGNMAALEATAVENAISQLGHRLTAHRMVDLRIDNSSVSAGMRRALARAPSVNERLVAPLRFLGEHHIAYTVTQIASAKNLADAPSRLRPTGAVDINTIDWSRGEVGRVASVVVR